VVVESNWVELPILTTLTKTPIDLCHFRSGHPSHKRIQHMKHAYSWLSGDTTFTCNTCYYAKQQKYLFH